MRPKKRRPVAREMSVQQIFDELQRDDLLPTILFRSSRRQCDEDVDRLARAEVFRFPAKKSDALRREIDSVIAKYQIEPAIVLEHPQYEALATLGVGAHHAGQLLPWRLLLEELMTRGFMRLMVATGTVAAGVDFPARSVVVTAHSRRGQEGFQNFTSSEFQQMSGRAGRRGKDAVGLCLVAPGHFCDARMIREIAQKPPEPLRSAYFASPSTVLNLLKYRSVDELRYMIERSLASFVDRKHSAHAIQEAEELDFLATEENSHLPESEQKKFAKRARRRRREGEALLERQKEMLERSLEGLKALGHLDDRGLTDKGQWAAELCTSLVLYLAEAIDEGLFYEKAEIELIALVSSLAGDSHRVYLSLAKNPFPKALYEELRKVVRRVADRYHGPSTIEELEVLPDAALTVISWAEAEEWSQYSALLRLAGVAEGDAARLISQTADHLHQLSRLRDSHPGLADMALRARSALLRPPLSDSLIIVD